MCEAINYNVQIGGKLNAKSLWKCMPIDSFVKVIKSKTELRLGLRLYVLYKTFFVLRKKIDM